MALKTPSPLSNSSFGSSSSTAGPRPPSSLPNSDFIIPDTPRKRAKVLLYGAPGTGKTSFATVYCPGPIAIINYDHRAHYAISEARAAGKEVHLAEVGYSGDVMALSDEDAKKLGHSLIAKTMRNIESAVASSLTPTGIRTIVLDTVTEYADMVSLAVAGRVDRGKNDDYGRTKGIINRNMMRIFWLADQGNANLVLLARSKEVYSGRDATGRYTYKCPAEICEGVDWAAEIRLKRGGGLGAARKGAPKTLEIEIAKGGTNLMEVGEVYDQSEWEYMGGPFAYACWRMYPGTTIEDWQS